jgi:hypothetical protein
MYADRHPQERETEQKRLHGVPRVLSAVAGWLIAAAAILAGIGWLYLLRDHTGLDAGPHLRGALPLEELTPAGRQPLLRMAVAWLPAGVAVGIALGVLTRVRLALIAVGAGILSFVILGLTTAASEALVYNERFSSHVDGALGRTGLWAAVAFIAAGSLLGAVLARAPRPRAASAAAEQASLAP